MVILRKSGLLSYNATSLPFSCTTEPHQENKNDGLKYIFGGISDNLNELGKSGMLTIRNYVFCSVKE